MASYYEQIIEDILEALGPGEVGQAIEMIRVKHHVSPTAAFEMLVRHSSDPMEEYPAIAAALLLGPED